MHTTSHRSRPTTNVSRPVFGLSGQWLVHDGALVPHAIVFSHPEQVRRLERDCPEAVPIAEVAGDPCYDRILASAPEREQYRRALGVRDGQRLIVVSSTWGDRSLFGRHPDLAARLLAELPLDEYRVAMALHPNIWDGHGPWQVRSWLRDGLDAGLLLVPPEEGWRAALVAADCVVGDHGSVTFYAAALGGPVLLAAFPDDDLDPDSPVARLGRVAPRLRSGSLRGQLEQAIDLHTENRYLAVTQHTSSHPGRSAELLRGLVFRTMGIPEPPNAPVLGPVPVTTPVETRAASAMLVDGVVDGGPEPVVRLVRHPHLPHRGRPSLKDPHLVAAAADPSANVADVLLRAGGDTRRAAPGCQVVATVEPGRCRIEVAGHVVDVRGGHPDGSVYASAVHVWWAAGRQVGELAPRLTVVTGGRRYVADVTVDPASAEPGA